MDDEIDSHLDKRTSRLVESSRLAELEKVTERGLMDAARARQERILVEKAEINPVTEEADMEGNQKRVEENLTFILRYWHKHELQAVVELIPLLHTLNQPTI